MGGFDIPQVMLATRAEIVEDELFPDSVRRRVESLRKKREQGKDTRRSTGKDRI